MVLSEKLEGDPVWTYSYTRRNEAPQASSEGLAPAECKDRRVFIFISEEIKKKNPRNKCSTNLPAVFSALASEGEGEVVNVRRDGDAGSECFLQEACLILLILKSRK